MRGKSYRFLYGILGFLIFFVTLIGFVSVHTDNAQAQTGGSYALECQTPSGWFSSNRYVIYFVPNGHTDGTLSWSNNGVWRRDISGQHYHPWTVFGLTECRHGSTYWIGDGSVRDAARFIDWAIANNASGGSNDWRNNSAEGGALRQLVNSSGSNFEIQCAPDVHTGGQLIILLVEAGTTIVIDEWRGTPVTSGISGPVSANINGCAATLSNMGIYEYGSGQIRPSMEITLTEAQGREAMGRLRGGGDGDGNDGLPAADDTFDIDCTFSNPTSGGGSGMVIISRNTRTNTQDRISGGASIAACVQLFNRSDVQSIIPLSDVTFRGAEAEIRDISKDTNDRFMALMQEILDSGDAPGEWPDSLGPGGGTHESPEDPWGQCRVSSLTWILCPFFEIASEAAESAYRQIEQILQIDSASLMGLNEATRDANGERDSVITVFRNAANIIFIILMMIAIMSQLTGYGLSNYNVKRMLPRLIIVAILTNLSFYLVLIAVDLSNIIGSQIYDLLYGLANFTPPEGIALETGSGMPKAGAVILLILGSGIALYFFAGAIGMFLLGAVLGFGLVLGILMIRQVGVLLLAAIAPLAIVCLLLPSTEGMFRKWRTMLTALLVVYPVCGLLMGIGRLASSIVWRAAVISENAEYNQFMMIVAMALTVIPLFGVIVVTKASLLGLGKIGAVVTGAMAGGAAVGMAGGAAIGRKAKNSTYGQAIKGWRDGRDRERLTGERTTLAARGLNKITGGRYKGTSLRGSMAGAIAPKTYSRVQSRAVRESDKQYAEDLRGSVAKFTSGRLGDDMTEATNIIASGLDLAERGDTLQLEGSLQALMERGKEEEAIVALTNAMGSADLSRKKVEALTSIISGNKSLNSNSMFKLMNKSYSKDLGASPMATNFSSLENKIRGMTPATSHSSVNNNFANLMNGMDDSQLGDIIANKDNAKALASVLGTDANIKSFMDTVSLDGSRIGGAIAAAKNADTADAVIKLVTANGSDNAKLADAIQLSGGNALVGWSQPMVNEMKSRFVPNTSTVAGAFTSGSFEDALSRIAPGTRTAIKDDAQANSRITDLNMRMGLGL